MKKFCIENICHSEEELKLFKATKKMSLSEFLTHAHACGGNWACMIMSGIRNLAKVNEDFKKLYNEMPDKEYDFIEIIDIIRPLVDIEKKD